MALTGPSKPTVHGHCSGRLVQATKRYSGAQLVSASGAGSLRIHSDRHTSLRNHVRPPASNAVYGILVRVCRLRWTGRSVRKFSCTVVYVHLRHRSDYGLVLSRGATGQTHHFRRCSWPTPSSRVVAINICSSRPLRSQLAPARKRRAPTLTLAHPDALP